MKKPHEMTLYDEKKLVAIELMGWGIYYPNSHAPEYTSFERGGMGAKLLVYNWNPQTERKWWPEIWNEMDGNQIEVYIKNLCKVLGMSYDPKQFSTGSCFWIHTAKPETCWKALIKTIKESIQITT